jgi:hypothetical protein
MKAFSWLILAILSAVSGWPMPAYPVEEAE